MTMPILTWKGMISSSMHFTHAFCCPGRMWYCRSSKNIEASLALAPVRPPPRGKNTPLPDAGQETMADHGGVARPSGGPREDPFLGDNAVDEGRPSHDHQQRR